MAEKIEADLPIDLQLVVHFVSDQKDAVIAGTVTDVSVGASQDETAVRFCKGVPVASDASMKGWMGYVYQDRPPNKFCCMTRAND